MSTWPLLLLLLACPLGMAEMMWMMRRGGRGGDGDRS